MIDWYWVEDFWDLNPNVLSKDNKLAYWVEDFWKMAWMSCQRIFWGKKLNFGNLKPECWQLDNLPHQSDPRSWLSDHTFSDNSQQLWFDDEGKKWIWMIIVFFLMKTGWIKLCGRLTVCPSQYIDHPWVKIIIAMVFLILIINITFKISWWSLFQNVTCMWTGRRNSW